MKSFNKLALLALSALSLSSLTSCAAGAATAGYAIKSQSADSLTASAEQRIINRAKAEIMADVSMQQQYAAPNRYAPVSE